MTFKKFIFPIVILLLGFILISLGALLKIIHFEIGPLTGNLVLTIGTFFKVIAFIWAILVLLKIQRDKT